MPSDSSEIEQALQAIAHEAFPDDVDVRWELRDIIEKGDFCCAQAEPVPPTVGYPQFRFVLRRGPGGAFVDHGCYCLDRGAWQLLYTTPDTSDEWKALKFDEAA